MSRNAWLVFFGMVIIETAGCSSKPTPPPPKVAVKGTVTLDGKPLKEGEILFSQAGYPPATMPIQDGAFSGEAMTGKNLVQVKVYKEGPPLTTDPDKKPTKKNIIPDRYSGPNSTLSADVTEGANDFKFAVTSR
jgi:hypothetical protein